MKKRKHPSFKQWLDYMQIVQNRSNFVMRDFVSFEPHETPKVDVDFRDEIDQTIVRDKIFQALETIPDRLRLVILYRFGFFNNRTYTLEEVGKIIGVERERVRQIEARALRKLRNPYRYKFFRGVLESIDKRIEEIEQEKIKQRQESNKRKLEYEAYQSEQKQKWDEYNRKAIQQDLERVRELDRRLNEEGLKKQQAVFNLIEINVEAMKDSRPYRYDAIKRIKIYEEK